MRVVCVKEICECRTGDRYAIEVYVGSLNELLAPLAASNATRYQDDCGEIWFDLWSGDRQQVSDFRTEIEDALDEKGTVHISVDEEETWIVWRWI